MKVGVPDSGLIGPEALNSREARAAETEGHHDRSNEEKADLDNLHYNPPNHILVFSPATRPSRSRDP
jgi:hypothetical protein